jgi:hypothetical protein
MYDKAVKISELPFDEAFSIVQLIIPAISPSISPASHIRRSRI